MEPSFRLMRSIEGPATPEAGCQSPALRPWLLTSAITIESKGRPTMGDKFENAAEEAKGKAKEAFGRRDR